MKKYLIKVKETIRLPQCVVALILIVLAIISIVSAKILYKANPFLSSLLSNVSAGLVTGISICLISGVKSVCSFDFEQKITFLDLIHQECLKFIKMYNGLFHKTEINYEYVYDLLCQLNNIDSLISQSQFDKTKSFNPYTYFKDEFGYDTVSHIKSNNDLREKVLQIDEDNIDIKYVSNLFLNAKESVFGLNVKVLLKIKDYKIKQNLSNKTIF